MAVSSEKQNKSHLPALEVEQIIFYTVITDYQNNTVAYIICFNLICFNLIVVKSGFRFGFSIGERFQFNSIVSSSNFLLFFTSVAVYLPISLFFSYCIVESPFISSSQYSKLLSMCLTPVRTSGTSQYSVSGYHWQQQDACVESTFLCTLIPTVICVLSYVHVLLSAWQLQNKFNLHLNWSLCSFLLVIPVN